MKVQHLFQEGFRLGNRAFWYSYNEDKLFVFDENKYSNHEAYMKKLPDQFEDAIEYMKNGYVRGVYTIDNTLNVEGISKDHIKSCVITCFKRWSDMKRVIIDVKHRDTIKIYELSGIEDIDKFMKTGNLR